MEKIFIQIASYRDPELLPTIHHCIKKAKNPELLTFGICWQHSIEDKWDNLDEFKDLPNFKIIDVDWKESLGLGWARSHIQKLWNGEKYTLQIDSHHRFLQNWDEELIIMLNKTGSPKPILTAYPGSYEPVDDDENGKIITSWPGKTIGKKFSNYGTIPFVSQYIDNWEKLDSPIPARFISGGFFFTLGIHCQEYKYDPNIYFAGDEISLSIRSYTLGYDLFHPNKLVIWHYYTREGKKKHWDDFNTENKNKNIVVETWSNLNEQSLKRLRHLLKEEDNNIDLKEYGLGNVRSHHDYEVYAGINFKLQKLHPDTVKGLNPPVFYAEDFDWDKLNLKKYNYEFQVPEYENLQFLYLGFQDNSGKELYRFDITDFSKKTVSVNFESTTIPYKYIWWPYHNGSGWGQKTDIIL